MTERFYAPDVERQILAFIFEDAYRKNAVLDEELAGLETIHLGSPLHRDILRAIQSLHKRGLIADPVTTFDEMGTTGNDADAPLALVLDAAQLTPDDFRHPDEHRALLPGYYALLREHWQRRETEKYYELLDSALRRRASPAELHNLTQGFLEAGTDGGRASRFYFKTLDEMRSMPKPEPMIDQILPAGCLSVVHGESGAGKTIALVDMAAHVCLGENWRGHETKQGPVWIVAAEGATFLLLNMEAWLRVHGLDDLTNLRIYDAPINLCEETDVTEFLHALEQAEEPPAWIILDTLSQTSIGYSDSDNGEMARYIDSMRRLSQACGAHVTVIHHNGHNGNMRGATALKGNVDTEIEITGNASNGEGLMSCKKQRGGWEPFSPMGFRIRKITLDDYGTFSGAVAESVDTPVVKLAPLTENQERCLDVLIDAGLAGFTHGDWFAAVNQSQPSMARSSFNNALKALDIRGLAKRQGSVYVAARKSKFRNPGNNADGPTSPSPVQSRSNNLVQSRSNNPIGLDLGPTPGPDDKCPARLSEKPHDFRFQNRRALVRVCSFCGAAESSVSPGA